MSSHKISSPLNNTLRKELADHVETLTHTGQKSLDSAIMKKIKNICKLSDVYVEHAYHLVLYHLEKQHAEIRYSAFQISDELFRRSHCFRELLVSNMQRILELTTETSPDHRLPPPKAAANNLKRFALRTIQEWNREYGDGYKKLQLGYNFLKHCKKVDFSALEMEDSAQRMRQQEIERRQNAVNQKRLQKVLTEVDELEPEITNTLTAMENCIGLLLPSPEDFFIFDENAADEKCSLTSTTDQSIANSTDKLDSTDNTKPEEKASPSSRDCDNMLEESENSESDSEEESNVNIRAHGMLSANFRIEVKLKSDISSIKETPENTAIFENARDLHTLVINRYIPCVKKWEQIITKSSGTSNQLKRVINLKQSLEDALKKYNKLNIKSTPQKGSDSSDSDFEEVEEKDGFEETVHEDLPILSITKDSATNSISKTVKEKDWSIWSKENNVMDPTTAQSTLVTLALAKPVESKTPADEARNSDSKNKIIPKKNDIKKVALVEPQPSTSKASSNVDSRKSKLLAVAPKLPFDIDLYHWEDENITAPTMLTVKPEGARFWSATSNDDLEEVLVPDGAACLRTRVIEFSGSYEPVKWACRVPLPNGKLCPRRDRHKCPFHGPIVARDETGQCTNPDDAEKLANEAEQKQRECPDWQEPKLLEEIKAMTGMDLKMPEKRKGGKKKKIKEQYPGLTDIKAKQNTSFTRLAKKVFKSSTMKRVAQTLDNADHKRFRDKYGDQFHYVHETA